MTAKHEFSERTYAEARELIARYPQSRSALLPLLHLVQAEEGYVSASGIEFCAAHLNFTTAEVAGVTTFYTMFKRHPTGEYLVSVCTNTLCAVLGGDDIYATLSEHLGIAHNETTEDGLITLEHVECLAACDYAPVVQINYEFFDQQTARSALDLVQRLQAGELPAPTRGAPLRGFREVSRELAGFPDERPETVAAGGSSGEPTLVGVKLAAQRGDRAPGYDEVPAQDENERDDQEGKE